MLAEHPAPAAELGYVFVRDEALSMKVDIQAQATMSFA